MTLLPRLSYLLTNAATLIVHCTPKAKVVPARPTNGPRDHVPRLGNPSPPSTMRASSGLANPRNSPKNRAHFRTLVSSRWRGLVLYLAVITGFRDVVANRRVGGRASCFYLGGVYLRRGSDGFVRVIGVAAPPASETRLY